MYSDADRKIYRPTIEGRQLGLFDPLAVRRRLVMASAGHINEFLADHAGEDDLKAAIAEEALVKAVRTAFELTPADRDGGVMDADAIDLLYDWMIFQGESPSTHATLPMQPPCTGC